MKQEAGRHPIEVNFTFMQVTKRLKGMIHTSELLKLIPNVSMGYGNIICKCRLVDCIYMDQEFLDMIQIDKQEFLCGEYSLGRYAWILEDVEILEKPIPAKGHLNIWNYEVNE